MKHLLGSSGVALLFLGCFSLVVLSQAHDRTKQRGEGRQTVPPAMPFDAAAVAPAALMWDPERSPAMLPREPLQHRRFGWKRLLDADANGEISLDEIDQMALNLKALDLDQDGKLTEDELPPNLSWRGGAPPFDAEAAFAPKTAETEVDQVESEQE